jgi:predicted extracellular nuclease
MGITEWMYNSSVSGNIGEFVEFTNLSSSPIDMSGWSFDDSSRTAGSTPLSAFGIVAPGESVILTDAEANPFRTNWSLSDSVKIIGNNANNLGRSDELNLYDNTNTLVDRLTFNDQGTGDVKGPRTNGVSANPTSLSDVGINNASHWILSKAGDAYGSFTNAVGDVGNPGSFPVPEPSTIALLLTATLGLLLGRRKF